MSARLPRIRGTQIGLRDHGLIDEIKTSMRMERYEFEAARGKIGGILDPQHTYHICEGHHRMAAALEILRETGDDTCVKKLLLFGSWTIAPAPPNSRPFPSRSFWGKLRNRLGF